MAEDKNARVMVQVFGTNMPVGGCGCGSGCGCGTSDDDAAAGLPTMEEQTTDLGQRLAHYYGANVAVEYVDIFSKRMDEFPSALRVVSRGNVPLPIIGFNGEAKFAGGISVEMISEELEELGLVPMEDAAEK